MLYLGSVFASGIIGGMILEYKQKTKHKREFEKAVMDKWDILMDSLDNSKSENKIEQTYKILEIIPKHYGFIAIVKIPYGKDSTEIQKLCTRIEVVYGGRVIIEPSNTDFTTCYIRVHLNGLDIEFKDDIKFRWYSHFKDKKFRNERGQTYRLYEGKDIKHPSKDNNIIVGTKFKIQLPSGLKFSDLKGEELELSKVFGIVLINYDEEKKVITCEIIKDKLGNKEPYSVLSVKSWEFYVGMEYSWKPIIVNTKETPHLMIAGTTGGGKTYAIITGLINLCNSCTPEELELYILSMSEKMDLAMFKDCRHTRYYADNDEKCMKLLNFLKKEMSRRNKIFSQIPMCFNIHRYNSKVKKQDRMSFIWVASDEIADIMELGAEVQAMIWDLIRKCRNVGINIIMASQRFSTNNLSAETKAQLGNKLIFNMANSASALTVASGDDIVPRITNLLKREFLCDCSDGRKIGKTLYIDEEMMINLAEPLQGDNKIELDINGKIIEKVIEIEDFKPKTDKNEQKIDKKPSRFEQMNNKIKEGSGF